MCVCGTVLCSYYNYIYVFICSYMVMSYTPDSRGIVVEDGRYIYICVCVCVCVCGGCM